MRQKYIVFDLGNVLIDWSPRRLYEKVISDSTRLEYFVKHVITSEWNAQSDVGVPFQTMIDERSREFPEFAKELSVYRSRWEEMLSGEIPGTSLVLKSLMDQGVPVYAITNFSDDTFMIARKLYPFLAWFKDIVVSAEHRVKKPDAKIFEIFLDRNGLEASDGLFIDDLSENIQSAKSLGFDGIVFQNANQLARDLKTRGWTV